MGDGPHQHGRLPEVGRDLMMGRRSEAEGRFTQTREEHGNVPTEQTHRAVGCMRKEDGNEFNGAEGKTETRREARVHSCEASHSANNQHDGQSENKCLMCPSQSE